MKARLRDHSAVIVLRQIFPTRSTCPECACTEYRRSGSSRLGLFCYRTCRKCRTIYRVMPIAKEVDRGGTTSEIVLC